MGEHVFSASQVDTYLLCPRKWAWNKVDGLEKVPSEAAELGTAVHAELEAYQRDGKPLNLLSVAGQIAMAGVHLLPPPRARGLLVEGEFHMKLGGHSFVGRKDWQILDRRPPLVGDHKTTKDFRWLKTPEVLRTDIQACLYAADAMLRAQHPECDLQWTYFRTKGGRAAEPVHLRVHATEIEPTLQRAVKAADEMSLILRSRVRAEEVPINPSACEAFGGCPYLSNCNLTPQQRFQAMMNQQATSDFLAKLQSRTPGPAAPPGAINPPEASPPPPPPGQPWPDHAAGVWRAPDGTPIGPIQTAPAAPPPPPPAPPAQPIWDGHARCWRDPATGQPIPEPPTYPVQSAPAPAAPPAAPAEAPAPPKRGPGRPRKSAVEAPPVQAPSAPAAPAPPEELDAADADRGARMALLVRQASSLLLTVASMLEEG